MGDIKIYHKDWNDNISIDYEKKILFRSSDYKEFGKYTFNGVFLLVIWEKWGKEYFYSNNNFDYYQITENDTFNLKIIDIYLVSEENNNKFLISLNDKKIYFRNNFDLYGSFDLYEDRIIIKREDENNSIVQFIYFSFKYYDINYLNKLFELISIDNIIYLLDRENDTFYYNFNMYKTGIYLKYKNKLSIKIDDIENIYVNDINNVNNLNNVNDININKYILYNPVFKEIDIDNLKLNKNVIFIVLDNNYDKEDIKLLITYIDYYENFNFRIIVYDHFSNKNKNNIYDNIDFIYYNDIDDIDKNILNLYIFNKSNFIDKDCIYEKYIDKESLNKIWFKKNAKNMDKYNFLLNQSTIKIPKIIHFIWIGNKKMPNIYINYIESWIKNHPEYTFCFWNDDNIPQLINQKYYDLADTYAMKADILRYELLYFFGGIYIDCDFLCLKNIDEIIKDLSSFSGYESDKYIAIGIMGFIKYDIVLLNLIKKISFNLEENINYNLSKNIPELTGPIFFTDIWLKYKTDKHYSFPPSYFYSYNFTDKFNNKKYKVNDDNYAIHMWGFSWKKKKDYFQEDNDEYYLINFYLSNILKSDINRISYSDLSIKLKDKIYYKINNNSSKKKIVHIMGLFFTGGIERYLYYLDKYGNHDIYEYYLLYISNGNYVYNIQNMKMISFEWNHTFLNKLLISISPDLIIDHYSIYLQNNEDIYKNINRNNIQFFIHSAIIYQNNISNLKINNCIHLYEESNKNESWNNINNNYYLTLGTELHNSNITKKEFIKKKIIHISIIGRIAEEKIPISFFEKLCILSKEINTIQFHIYGEKDKVFNREYVEKFEKLITKSNITLHNFVNPLEMEKIYLDTDILLIPSTYETGSFTCIEAFSYGIPVIARNVYGLKYLIKNNITGYLCENDSIMVNKIKNISNDVILKNYNIIKNESLKYNIIHKIKDLEDIICKNTINKNIIIITSVINCVNKPLSYYPTRSVYNMKERYNHTIKSIESIKKYISNIEILFCECSDLKGYEDLELEICNKVDYYFNFYENEIIREAVNSEMKGLGESNLLLEAIDKILNLKKTYNNVFKLSGRYFLNNNFNFNIFNNDKNIFTFWDNSNTSYCTIFYKISFKSINLFKNALLNAMEDLSKGESIEQSIYKYFTENIHLIDKLNISGLLATEGYLFSV